MKEILRLRGGYNSNLPDSLREKIRGYEFHPSTLPRYQSPISAARIDPVLG